ncbi:MAG: hypothetical protein LBJ73_00630 [Rickettsiales bacterium]|jgi:dihydrofolate reductase|nr:hypothetical protein [Rickettsiales bacterium]
MNAKYANFPEVNLIITTAENGLVTEPYDSSLALKWFDLNTIGYPVIFDGATAQNMPLFSLRNRPCAVASNKCNTGIVPDVFSRGPHLTFGIGAFYDPLGEALRFYKNYDKAFITGGHAMCQNVLRAGQTGTELMTTPRVDAIFKTVLPKDACPIGKVPMDEKMLGLMSAPNFELYYYIEYGLGAMEPGIYEATDHTVVETKEEAELLPRIPAEHKLEKTDTPFPTIRFEIWKRAKQNSGK